jgi:hypothetical protein
MEAREAFYPTEENAIPEVGEEEEGNANGAVENDAGESSSSSDTDSIVL